MDFLRQEAISKYSMKLFKKKNSFFFERIKGLINISKEINNFVGDFLLIFVTFCLLTFVSAMHVGIIYIIYIVPGIKHEKLKTLAQKGIALVFGLVAFTILKLGIFIHAGEKLQKMVRKYYSY
jgi:hypothetical protein